MGEARFRSFRNPALSFGFFVRSWRLTLSAALTILIVWWI
jgi:hypothetical protein